MSADKPRPFMNAAGELFLWETMKLLVQQKGPDDVETAARAMVRIARADCARATTLKLRSSLPSNVIPFPGRD